MKKLLLLSTLISITTISATSWFGGWFNQTKSTVIVSNNTEITPSEKIITQTFTLSSVPTKIFARSQAQVVIKSIGSDAVPYVKLRTHENLFEYLTPQENNNTLRLGFFHNVNTYTINSSITMEYTVYIPLTNNLKKLEASNHATITVDDQIFNNDTNLVIKNHNHGKITVSNLIANNLKIETTNHGKTVANVNVDILDVNTTNHGSTIITGIVQSKNITATRHAKNTIDVLIKK